MCIRKELWILRYINRNKRYKKAGRAGRCGAALCAALLAGSFLPTLSGCSRTMSLKVEAGEPIPNTIQKIGVDITPYLNTYGSDFLNHAGTYDIPMTDGNGRKYSLRLTVVDYDAPSVIPKHVYMAQGGPLPEAADCIGSIVEVDTYTASFVGEVPDFAELGDYDVSFRVEDASGNSTKTLATVVSVIRDTQAPVFTHVPELSAYVGEALAYTRELVVTDNCCGEVSISVDSSRVNASTPGDYTVTYTATDSSGNTASAVGEVHIYANQISEDALNAKVDELLAQITTPDMTVEGKLRAAYDYIQGHIAYVSDSDKSDWVRAAYESLFVTGSGDCFDYFAAAKAVIRRLGLDYREIQRTPGLTEETHYWLMVNIGTSTDPQWYHYDCTRLRADYNHSGCLLTDKQINAYNKVRPYFYAYDASQYPASATKIITKTPTLEPFY